MLPSLTRDLLGSASCKATDGGSSSGDCISFTGWSESISISQNQSHASAWVATRLKHPRLVPLKSGEDLWKIPLAKRLTVMGLRQWRWDARDFPAQLSSEAPIL